MLLTKSGFLLETKKLVIVINNKFIADAAL